MTQQTLTHEQAEAIRKTKTADLGEIIDAPESTTAEVEFAKMVWNARSCHATMRDQIDRPVYGDVWFGMDD